MTELRKLSDPRPFSYDPYVAVRQAQLVDTDIESAPEEAPLEVEELQLVGFRIPLMGEEFEAFESIARIAKAASLSPSSFCKRYRSSYETSSSLSLTLPVQNRYRGTSELILDTNSEGDELGDGDIEEDESNESQGLEGEGLGLSQEEVALEGQQQAVLVVNTVVSEPLGLGYGEARRRALESIEEIAPSTYEVGQSSRFVPKQKGVERISAFRQSTLVTWVDPEDNRVYTDVPAYAPPTAPVQTPPSLEWSSDIDRCERAVSLGQKMVRDRSFSRSRLYAAELQNERSCCCFRVGEGP
ncbi:hypothetical protein Tco_0329153 [Tanacetum coccineum]